MPAQGKPARTPVPVCYNAYKEVSRAHLMHLFEHGVDEAMLGLQLLNLCVQERGVRVRRQTENHDLARPLVRSVERRADRRSNKAEPQ